MAKNTEHAGKQGNTNGFDFGELLGQPTHHSLGHGESNRGAGHALSSLDGMREASSFASYIDNCHSMQQKLQSETKEEYR